MDALKLTFVNVGYGEAVLLECPDRTRPGGNFVMVIDGGSAEPMEYLHTQSGRIRLAEYLQSHVDHIDIMVNTHPHEDHVSGLCAAARLFPPQQLRQTLDGGFCRHTLHPLHVEAQNDAQRKCLKGLSDWQDLMGQVVLHGGAIRRLTAGDDVLIATGCKGYRRAGTKSVQPDGSAGGSPRGGIGQAGYGAEQFQSDPASGIPWVSHPAAGGHKRSGLWVDTRRQPAGGSVQGGPSWAAGRCGPCLAAKGTAAGSHMLRFE